MKRIALFAIILSLVAVSVSEAACGRKPVRSFIARLLGR